MQASRHDLPRTLLAILFIALLLTGSLLVLRPFLPALVWATMLAVASWPLMRSIQARLGGSRAAAVTVMSLSLLLVLIVPLTLAIVTLVTNAGQLVDMARGLQQFLLSPPPEWMARIPLVGNKIVQFWTDYASIGLQGIALKLAPYMQEISHWFASHIGSLGMLVLQFLLTVVFAGILFAQGEVAADAVRRFAYRLAGEQGEGIVKLSAQAIRGVALGVGVTALVQSLLGGLGLLICGVPFVAILTALMFMLCIAQIGPIPILALAIGWLFWSGDSLWGGVLVVITLLVGSLDNVIRPILIKRGADLPLLLIFGGVIGGLMAFGLVGIFLGPLLLAVSYTLIGAWINQTPAGDSADSAPAEATPPQTEGDAAGLPDAAGLRRT